MPSEEPWRQNRWRSGPSAERPHAKLDWTRGPTKTTEASQGPGWKLHVGDLPKEMTKEKLERDWWCRLEGMVSFSFSWGTLEFLWDGNGTFFTFTKY